MHSNAQADQGQASGISLDKLQPGRCGLVVDVVTDTDDAKRLMAMGVCVGRIIKLEQLGDPMILQVVGTKLGVSKRLGAAVNVIPCEEKSCAERDGSGMECP